MKLFISGLIIGMLVSAPLGPIGALCIHRALNNGFKVALITGLGAAVADAVCGAVIVFGLTLISTNFIAYQSELQLIGGLVLLYLGAWQYFKAPKDPKVKSNNHSLWFILASSFLLTLTNPASFLLFLALVTGFGLDQFQFDWLQKIFFISGIFLGATLTWLVISASVTFIFKKYLSSNALNLINLIFGALFLILGFFVLSKLTLSFLNGLVR